MLVRDAVRILLDGDQDMELLVPCGKKGRQVTDQVIIKQVAPGHVLILPGQGEWKNRELEVVKDEEQNP
jgi:hypothetical protein